MSIFAFGGLPCSVPLNLLRLASQEVEFGDEEISHELTSSILIQNRKMEEFTEETSFL